MTAESTPTGRAEFFRRASVGARSWPRFSSYEVVDGRLVPTADAELERYDVWSGDPVDAVLALAHSYETTPPRGFAEEAASWASHHGLLGLGLARLLHTRYTVGGILFGASRAEGALRLFAVYDKVPDAPYVPFASVAPGLLTEVLVYTVRLGYPIVDLDDPATYWQGYGVGGEGELPLLGSESFWRGYGESLAEIGVVVSDFARAAHSYGNIGGGRLLESLASDAALRLHNDVVSWHATSLLGASASLAVQQFGGGYRFNQCDCGRVFAAKHYDKKPDRKYCSPTCKARVKQRGVRARKKEGIR